MSRLFSSFRIRFLMILAVLLLATLAVQYILNLRAERNNARVINEQVKAFVAGVALGVKSIGNKDYLFQLREKTNEPLLDRVTNILVVDEYGRVTDSLDTKYNPVLNPNYDPKKEVNIENEKNKYQLLQDVPLPPAIVALELVGESSPLQPTTTAANFSLNENEPRAFFIPITGVITSPNNEVKEVTRYIVIVLSPPEMPSGIFNRQAAKPLLYTLVVLLIATTLAGLLVWRFTQPIAALSSAASKIAGGQLNFRVPAKRRDEMGQLVTQFNEMIAGLERGRELEAKLSQAEQSAVVGRLASGIAHEIRNPLNYINLTLDRLRTSYKPADETKEEKYLSHINNLKDEVKRINKLVTDFLSFTRPRELEMKPLDLIEELYSALRIIEDQASENDIETEIKSTGKIPVIIGDQESLRSVFTNLFINAVQAIGIKGGAITVNVRAEKNRVRIEVKDTGCGIAPEHLSKLFEPYFSTKETGTGLGLPIVKKNIEEHKGTIDVQSTPNEGTTFTVTLPLEGRG